MPFVLRPASEADQNLIAHLEEVCMRDYATALWGQWLPQPADDFLADRHRIIVSGNVNAGCIETIIRADHLWLSKLYLLPSHQRRGLGAEVLREIIVEAGTLGLPLRLSVLTTNPAQAFYRREGLNVRTQDQERITFEMPHSGPVVAKKL